jgi:hypothetical protein
MALPKLHDGSKILLLMDIKNHRLPDNECMNFFTGAINDGLLPKYVRLFYLDCFKDISKGSSSKNVQII